VQSIIKTYFSHKLNQFRLNPYSALMKVRYTCASSLTDFDKVVKELSESKDVEDSSKVPFPKRIEHVGITLERPKKAAKEKG